VIRHAISNLNGWLAILAVVLSSSAGDVLLSRAMKQIGDVGALRRRRGLIFVVLLVSRNRYFLLGVGCMAVAFYSLLFGLSWNDVSLIGPAAASLTFVANAVAAKIFLHEHVNHRRWAAALLVGAGVALMAL
jgi:multidrug transporter EmrE-like cation transporter